MKRKRKKDVVEYKSLCYAYPSSFVADMFKKPKGCWYVGEYVGSVETVPNVCFDTRREAIGHGKGLPYPWHPLTLAHNLDIPVIESHFH